MPLMNHLLYTNASPESQKINIEAPLHLLYDHITCFSYSEAVPNVSPRSLHNYLVSMDSL